MSSIVPHSSRSGRYTCVGNAEIIPLDLDRTRPGTIGAHREAGARDGGDPTNSETRIPLLSANDLPDDSMRLILSTRRTWVSSNSGQGSLKYADGAVASVTW